jgi:hypothetical protein
MSKLTHSRAIQRKNRPPTKFMLTGDEDALAFPRKECATHARTKIDLRNDVITTPQDGLALLDCHKLGTNKWEKLQ